MKGISLAIRKKTIYPLGIILKGDQYRIEGKSDVSFERSARDEWLIEWTTDLLKYFKKLASLVVKHNTVDFTSSKELNEKSIRYTEDLIDLGGQAFNQFFEDSDAYDFLTKKMAFYQRKNWNISPFFWSKKIPYPWELLYPREITSDGDPISFFWGMHYPLSRNLSSEPFELHVDEQQPECDMLFALHKSLVHARTNEWPGLKKITGGSGTRGTIKVVGGEIGLCLDDENLCDARDLLKYLYKSTHNMLHFACHCKRKGNDDMLQLSWIENNTHIADDGISGTVASINLSPRTFLRQHGKFVEQQPLVFINACQSTGEIDDITVDFNLPAKFVGSKAAAVVATMCSVPDLFAAAFAQKFYEHFLIEGVEIAEALRATRWFFWEKFKNPLGLAYGLYSSPFYKVRQPEIEGSLI
jgi:hypothetical protein